MEFSRKLEIAANLAILILAGIIGFRLLGLHSGHSGAPAIRDLQAGSPVNLSSVDWHQNEHTLVVAVQVGCPFCTASSSFYKQLIDAAKGKQIHIVVAAPQEVTETREYAGSIGLTGADIRQVSLAALQVRGTPTLILADSSGRAASVWRGKIPTAKEAGVLNEIRAASIPLRSETSEAR